MEGLSNRSVLTVWERGQGQHPLERSLTILATALPECSREELANLSIGTRDALLLDLNRNTFGDRLDIWVSCPACRERLEFDVRTSNLLAMTKGHQSADHTLKHHGFDLRFRLPNSYDLAAAIREPDPDSACRRLIDAVVIQASRDGRPSSIDRLIDGEADLLSEALMNADPLCEIQFNLSCPSCGHTWAPIFDAGAYLWSKIEVCAVQLLSEVHILARAYAWSEEEILSLSDTRRNRYLGLIEAL